MAAGGAKQERTPAHRILKCGRSNGYDLADFDGPYLLVALVARQKARQFMKQRHAITAFQSICAAFVPKSTRSWIAPISVMSIARGSGQS